jgi:enoyl-CoA hydratase/carnithine racemase
MSYETLLTEARDGVDVVKVNRPDVRNALNRRIIESVRSTLDRFRKDDGVGTVILPAPGRRLLPFAVAPTTF